MHTRTPGPKQTVPARLMAGCDNQIENFPLWGVRWTTPRRRLARPVESLVHPITPNVSDPPHARSLPRASVLALRPPSTREGGSVTLESPSVAVSHMSPSVDPYTADPTDTRHGCGEQGSTGDDALPGPRRDSGAVPTKRSIHLEPISPHSTHTPCSFPTPELAVARKRCRTRLPQGHGPHEVLPASAKRAHVVTSDGSSMKFGGSSSSPTLGFLPGTSIAPPTLDTLVPDVHRGSLSNTVEESASCPDGDARIHYDGTTHGFFIYPPEYQLSSYSELSAFASDGGSVPKLRRPH